MTAIKDSTALPELAWSIATVARALGVGEMTVRRAVDSGEIAAFKLFGIGALRISVFELSRAIQADPVDVVRLFADLDA